MRAATVEAVEAILRQRQPRVPHGVVRKIISCLRIGRARRPDPPGVSISKGVLVPGRRQPGPGRDPPVQICFSFDTTGSMSAYVEQVKRELAGLVKYLVDHIPGIEISITAHGDYGDESNYVVKAINFSNDAKALDEYIQSCGPTGGGDMPECYELVMHKMQELNWAATSAKALVMIGDAPPHGREKYRSLNRGFIDWEREAKWYAQHDIRVYGVKCGGSRETFYDMIAQITGALVIKLDSFDLMPELFTELCFREQQRWALERHPAPAWDVHAIHDPKMALLNVCGSCLLHQPTFHEPVNVTKQRIFRLCRRLAREGRGEFVLKMALYCRTQLNLRSVSNFLAAVAAETKGCKEHLGTYFKYLIKLPTDMQEVAKMSVSQRPFPSEGGQKVWLPRSLRSAFAKKFGDFSEYQLAKHKKTERFYPDGSWRSAKPPRRRKEEDDDAPPRKGRGKGKGKGEGRKEMPLDSDVEGSCQGPVLSMKCLIRCCHITQPPEMIMKVLGKRYPSSAEEFEFSGLPGTFDEAQMGRRLKLAEPLTFQTQLSKKGNSKESWEDLIDKKGLPFMAMLRNLRNILQAGVSERHHEAILRRLQDARQVAQSKQMPHRFLTAYLAVDAAAKGQAFGNNARGKPSINDGALPPLPEPLVERYKAALDCAVQLAATASCPGGLKGRTLVLCDVSGSMRYNEFAQSAKGIAGVASAADLAILMGVMLFYMSEGPEDCRVALFSDGPPVPLGLKMSGGVLAQFQTSKTEVAAMGKKTQLPLKWLEEQLSEFPGTRVVIFSDMLLGQNRDHPGIHGGRLQTLLAEHRKRSGAPCTLVCVDLFGSGAQSGLDLSGAGGDILISGFSDNVLAYIANPSFDAQLADVEAALETAKAEEAKRLAKPKRDNADAAEEDDEVDEPGADALIEGDADEPGAGALIDGDAS